MKLVKEADPILFKRCDPFDFNEPIMDPYELVEGLHEIRRDGKGIGLAAPQVGLATQVLVIGMGDFKTEGVSDYDQCFFNPVITRFSDETEVMIEGCLSFPDLVIKVKRPKDIEVTWDSEEGSECSQSFAGMTSRILQHEIDHLDGITFLKRADRYHLQKAQKDRKMQERYRKRQERDKI